MVTAPATGNINYINWVKQQTVVPDFEKKKELPAPKVVVKPTPSAPNVVKKNAIGADDNTKATADFASMD